MCAGRRELKPVWWYIDLKIHEVIAYDMFGDPAFSASFEEAMQHYETSGALPDTYRDSPEYRRICDSTGVDVLGRGNGLYQLHYDGCSPFNSSVHSTGLIGVTCSSLLPEHQSRSYNICPLIIVPPEVDKGAPTRKEPKHYQPMINSTLAVFAGMHDKTITPILLNDSSEHVPYLDGVGADSIGRPKAWTLELQNSSSFFICAGCRFLGYR